MKKILTIIGARPQFIKAGVVSRRIKESNLLTEVICHTGQHFDNNMSQVFFEQLAIPRPRYNLGINSCTHGAMTGLMMIELEKLVLKEKPDAVMVFGDTNSTLAGAIVASKLHVPIIHVESGLRSFDNRMPEEINRILTDQISDYLFCPSDVAVNNLHAEGFDRKDKMISQVGDVMKDSLITFGEYSVKPAYIDGTERFILLTLHRQENTNDPERLVKIVKQINHIHHSLCPVYIPLHPRTRGCLDNAGVKLSCHIIEPLSYFEMLWAICHSSLVITDSGGLQKEAYLLDKYCLTLRGETEWSELVEEGVNSLFGENIDELYSIAKKRLEHYIVKNDKLYGNGDAAEKIVSLLEQAL